MRYLPVVLLFVLSNGAFAQSFLIGPSASYIVSTAVPDEVSQVGSPTRMAFGLHAVMPSRNKLEFRFDLSYRIENGEFATNYTAAASAPADGYTGSPGNQLHVVEPTPGPKVNSTLNTSSVELGASMVFPVAELDTSGSALVIQLGVLADRVLNAEQVDDYSQIPDYTGEQTVEIGYEGQFGFGALLGVGIILPVGADRISFDIRYVFRQPNTITSTTTPPVDQTITWLIGRGLRVGVSYLFAL